MHPDSPPAAPGGGDPLPLRFAHPASDRDALYFAALLRNLDVFLRRAGLPERVSRLGGEVTMDTSGPRSIFPDLLRIAEECADPEPVSAPRHSEEDAASGMRLESPFSHITLERGGERLGLPVPRHLGLGPLSIRREALFPIKGGPTFDSNPYPAAARSFLDELEAVEDAAGLYALLEKYLYAVPLGPRAPDVSLFDHARTTAAVALCLYDEYTLGSWRGEEVRIRAEPEKLPEPCLLVSGDVSGIQDFIFDVPTKRAAKSLKGRSWFVQLAADACVRYLSDRLDLKEASLLYSGGGNFFLLVPACREPELLEARRAIVEDLLSESPYLALGWARVGVADFREGGFAACWKAAHDQVERRKERRFQELGAGVFEPLPQARRSEAARVGEEEPDRFAKLTELLSRGTCYEVLPRGEAAEPERFRAPLGLDVRFGRNDGNPRATAFNRTDFAGRFRDFRFAVKDLPRFDEPLLRKLYPSRDEPPEIRPGTLIDFNHLARLAEERTGTEKLGVLKMDVDDLGRIFLRGFPEPLRGIARIAALSRSMKWFFEGYVNTLLHESFAWTGADPEPREAPFRQQLYPVFSGGDDFLLVGAWDAVFEFARRVRSEFAAFVGHHPGITLSAVLLVLEPKYSVVRFAAEADRRLDDVKHASEGKDRVGVFGHVLTWGELEEAAALKRRLEVLVKHRGESRAIVQRVQQSATGYERLQDAAVRGQFRPEKIWRLAYFLARNAKKENLDEVRSLAEIHQELLLEVFVKKEAARNPALFTVAGRWAELATRAVASDAEDRRTLSSR